MAEAQSITGPVHDVLAAVERLPGVFPSSHLTAGGIAFDLADVQGACEAVSAIRRRATVQSFIPARALGRTD